MASSAKQMERQDETIHPCCMRDEVSMEDVWLAQSVVEHSVERDCLLTSASIVSDSNSSPSPISQRKVAGHCRDPSHAENV